MCAPIPQQGLQTVIEGDRREWCSAVFTVALVVSVLTGKACFHGLYSWDESPRMYWMTVVSCEIFAALVPVAKLLKG